MVPVQDGASTQGENLLLPPKEVSKMHGYLKILYLFLFLFYGGWVVCVKTVFINYFERKA